jgi:DNA-binding NarL/FixJ family response regulator
MTRTLSKLVIADDHPVVLHGLISLLKGEPNCKIMAACLDGGAAMDAIFSHAPDIAILDLRLPKMSGLDVLDKISTANLKTRVVILTAYTEDRDVLVAITRGAYGVIMKDSVADLLIECIRRVRIGDRYIAQELIEKEMRRLTDAKRISQVLTGRELEVVRLIAEGLPNKLVAERLGISLGTLKLHLHHVFCKTGTRSRESLLSLARHLGDELDDRSPRLKI